VTETSKISVTAAAVESPSASVAEWVTFFEDRAEVVRRAHAQVPAGASWVAIAGVGVAADDASLVARVAGDVRVLTTKLVRRVRQVPAASAAELAAIEADFRKARARRQAAERTVERAAAAERRTAHLPEEWARGIGRVPHGGSLEAARWKLAHAEVGMSLAAALDETAAAAAELDAARLDEARAQVRYDQGRAMAPRFEAHACVQLDAPAGGAFEIELSYRTPLALWRPEHVARLTNDGKPSIELRTAAVVWQRTGEDWEGVRCRFSTARPAQAATPPLLTDDVLRLQRRADRTVHVEGRDVVVATAGSPRGGRAVDEMPGVDDGGQPLVYEATRPVTIPSDGQPFRVDIDERRLACTAELVVFPELAPVAYHRATATLTGSRPLLAGPVRVARGASMVGRGRTGFVGEGEPFELGFGADDGVRVRRRVDEKRETGVTGTLKLTRTVHLYLSNLGGASRRVTVIERVPVSELEEVTVKVVQGGGAILDEKDGFARFEIDLAGGATQELTLGYRVEAKSNVRLDLGA